MNKNLQTALIRIDYLRRFSRLFICLLSCSFLLVACGSRAPSGSFASTQDAKAYRESTVESSRKSARQAVEKSAGTPTPRLTELPVHAVARMDANCRWGPGEEYQVVSGLKNGQAARLLGANREHSWWLVEIPGGTSCWMAAFTVELNRPVKNLPLVTAPPSTSAPTATPVTPTPRPTVIYREFELEVLRLINLERERAGVSELRIDSALTIAARLHCNSMARDGYFSHTGSDGSNPFERIQRQGFSYSYAAENIAAGHGTPQEAVQAWMDSSGHRENMLNPRYSQVGIAYFFDEDSEYITYWAAEFASP